MHTGTYLGLVDHALRDLADAYRHVVDAHREEPDIVENGTIFAQDCERQADELAPFIDRYGEEEVTEPGALEADLFSGPREGGVGLVRDLHDLYVLGHFLDISWTILGQAARGLRDRDMIAAIDGLEQRTAAQVRWLKTRMKQAAPQALVVG